MAAIDDFDQNDWDDYDTYPTLTQAAPISGMSRSTLARHVRLGSLPSALVRGEYRVARGDLVALFGPVPSLGIHGMPQDESLRVWAQRMAKAAPPLRPEQRDVVLAALADALVVTGGE